MPRRSMRVRRNPQSPNTIGKVSAMSSDPEMSLQEFKSVEWPDVLAVKMIYNDVRAVTAVLNEGEYVYRLNSVFDPDFTGVGGQPEGFDQLKALYGRYRVMACKAEVSAASLTSGNAGVIAMAPSENAALSTTAEQLGGLRNSAIAEYSFGGGIAKMKKTWHIGPLLGMSDASCLASSNTDAPIGGNPAFQQLLYIQFRDSSATGSVQLSARLTYYVRMELTTTVIDTFAQSRFRRLDVRTKLLAADAASSADSHADASASTPLPENGVLVTQGPSTSALLELQKSIQRALAAATLASASSVAVRQPSA